MTVCFYPVSVNSVNIVQLGAVAFKVAVKTTSKLITYCFTIKMNFSIVESCAIAIYSHPFGVVCMKYNICIIGMTDIKIIITAVRMLEVMIINSDPGLNSALFLSKS